MDLDVRKFIDSIQYEMQTTINGLICPLPDLWLRSRPRFFQSTPPYRRLDYIIITIKWRNETTASFVLPLYYTM